MTYRDAREGKWRGNWRMEWVASTLHTTSELDVSSITTADAHTSAASSRLNWRPCRFKWTRPFRRKRNVVSARVPSNFKRSLPVIVRGGSRQWFILYYQILGEDLCASVLYLTHIMGGVYRCFPQEISIVKLSWSLPPICCPNHDQLVVLCAVTPCVWFFTWGFVKMKWNIYFVEHNSLIKELCSTKYIFHFIVILYLPIPVAAPSKA